MKINEAIKTMMDEQHVSAMQLAYDMDVTPQSINSYINGSFDSSKGSLKIDTVMEIAEFLGYTLNLLPRDSVPDNAIKIDEQSALRRRKSSSTHERMIV